MKFLTHSDRIALLSEDQQISYAQLIQAAKEYAQLYSAEEGDRIIICSENRLEWAYAFYSIWYKGAIPIPMDGAAPIDDMIYILKDAQPRLVFCSKRTEAAVREALRESCSMAEVLVLDSLKVSGVASTDEFPDSNMDATAAIIYSSGTTGQPKGTMLSYRNFYSNIRSLMGQDFTLFNENERILMLLPLHHVLPLLATLIGPVFAKTSIVVESSLASNKILRALQQHKVTLMVGVPRLLEVLRNGILNKIKEHLLGRVLFGMTSMSHSLIFSRYVFRQVQQQLGGHLKYLICGGALLDPQIVKDFRAMGVEVLVGYGMTEASPVVSVMYPGCREDKSAGKVLSHNEVRIENGEILIRGENVMQGYYNRPEETAEILRDGWLHSGDLGHLDSQNHLFITGRKKEIVALPSGKNVNLNEVEKKIASLSNLIGDVAVFPGGNGLHAMIYPDLEACQRQYVVKPEEVIQDRVIALYNQKTASYKRILKCWFVNNPLPRTSIGKLKRHRIEKLAEELRTEKKSS